MAQGLVRHGVAAAAAVLALASAARAAPPDDLLQASERGRALIAAAAERLGGAERLRHVTSLHYRFDGESFNGLQGYDPANLEAAVPSARLSTTVDLDYAGHRHRRSNLQVLPGDIHLEAVSLFKDGRIVTAYPGTGRMTAGPGPEGAVSDGIARYSPPILMARLLDRLGSAVFIGQGGEGGARTDLVEVSWDAGTRLRLHLDAADHRLRAVEAVGIDPLIGDDDLVYAYEGERRVDGLAFPERVSLSRHGHPYMAARITEAAINGPLDAALFETPAFRPLTTQAQVNALGEGVYELTGLEDGTFRVVFFDLGDGVAVFDAPESRARSKAVAAEIAKALGDKPIRYLVASHFHDDHVAGVGYYVDEGVTIVTTRANAPILARYATTNSKVRPDLPAAGRTPRFAFVDGDHLDLTGTSGRVWRIYRLADCPHAKDMLTAYEPRGKLIVEADLFVELAPFSGASAAFERWMRAPGAPAVDWIVGTHQARISREAFEAAGKT
jgi:glyoxylase-like metal-dependent hydrolase (beta-lactamase superfamily II)